MVRDYSEEFQSIPSLFFPSFPVLPVFPVVNVNLPMQRNKRFVLLMLAFPHQKLVVAAAARIRIAATDCWPMLIDCAIAFGRMQKLTGAFVNSIAAMAQHPTVTWNNFRKPLFSFFSSQSESFAEPCQIALFDDDVIIRATITGAFRAIELKLGFCGQHWEFEFGHNLRISSLFFPE